MSGSLRLVVFVSIVTVVLASYAAQDDQNVAEPDCEVSLMQTSTVLARGSNEAAIVNETERQLEVERQHGHVLATDPVPHFGTNVPSVIFVLMVCSIPLVIMRLGERKFNYSNAIECIVFFVWTLSACHCFNQVINFSSAHYAGSRSLEPEETIYLVAQIITTVGYGDFTPATERDQKIMTVFLITAMFLLADILQSFSSSVMKHTTQVLHSVNVSAAEALLINQEEDSLKKEHRVKHVAELRKLGIVFLTKLYFHALLTAAWVCFYANHPGEDKTAFGAFYSSIVTSSTIGFGSIVCKTKTGMCFGAFFMVFLSWSMASLIMTFVDISAVVRDMSSLDKVEENERIISHLANIKPDSDGRVHRGDFLAAAMVGLKLINEEQMSALENLFHSLGVDDDGKVHHDNLKNVDSKQRLEDLPSSLRFHCTF